MNTFLNSLKEANNYTLTENCGVAYKSTLSAVYDLFALGGAYRQRSDEDCILLFKNAFEESRELALKCLFYIGDCRGGAGERRFFRVCFRWLADKYPDVAHPLVRLIPEYRRWDDLIYACEGTMVENTAFAIIKKQLELDVNCKTPSLLGKWLPSENCSSVETKRVGNIIRQYLDMSHREYRKTLSELRSRINIVEKLMSSNRWGEIQFDMIPSRAGLIYRNAFARRDILAKKYEAFIKDENTTVNADTLYPYDIVGKALQNPIGVEREAVNKYWANQKNWFGGKQSSILCMVDTSGSMTIGKGTSTPINVAISLGIYCAERAGGPFKDHYISFSRNPQLIHIEEGIDFVDKVRRIYNTNLCENTNLTKAFDMLLNIATRPDVKKEDIPHTICVISDMAIDEGTRSVRYDWRNECHPNPETEMEVMRAKWEKAGLVTPRLVYWNVNARDNLILEKGENISLVSGASPAIFEAVISGKSGIDLMLDKLLSERYNSVLVY